MTTTVEERIGNLEKEFVAIRETAKDPDGRVEAMVNAVAKELGRVDREFLTLIGAATGILLVKKGFHDIHVCAEKLLGRPICTHEFGSGGVGDELRVAAIAKIEEVIR